VDEDEGLQIWKDKAGADVLSGRLAVRMELIIHLASRSRARFLRLHIRPTERGSHAG
jgi:hypothetical protein